MSKKAPEKKKPLAEAPEKKEMNPQKSVKATPKAEKKKEERGIHTLYQVEGEKVTRLRPTCERCGTGYFMANHKDRYTCGHCGFTRYKQVEK